ncbi:MAG TPA: winged helix-turn-helix transcriptional regulator [Candidatus Nitrosopolaris sp.]|nr:winged helix-turn-helix transcriptional regulator [Candidatus Nitrosopolaris sp.]
MVSIYSVARADAVVSIWGRSLLVLKNLTNEVIRFTMNSGDSRQGLAVLFWLMGYWSDAKGLCLKRFYPQIPPKVEYSLTVREKELGEILRELGKGQAGGKYLESQRTRKRRRAHPDQLSRDGTNR